MPRIALSVEYDGTDFSGWQTQKDGRNVQDTLQTALSQVADESIDVVCAGRTDAGVHALAQIVHFDTTASRSNRSWVLGANTNLPHDVNVNWATEVSEAFHARFSARSRTYRYRILNRTSRSALERHRAHWAFKPLDHSLMEEAAAFLLGEHDFSAFRAAACQAKSPHRNVQKISVQRRDDWVTIEVQANAFLQHMVRNIAGVLLEIGHGEQPPSWAQTVLASKDRRQGGVTAPAQGLYFVHVEYPPEAGLKVG